MLNPEPRPSARLQVSHLQELEAESIFVIREVAAQFERPVLLFSGGKDSIILSHLARKAFWPARIPFPLLHIDTGHNFPETLTYRDEWMETIGAKLIVRSVQDSIDQGRAVEEKGYSASRNMLQTVTLLDAIEELKVDAALGGARRDEEKARAKERFFSHRDEFGQWDPKNQRPGAVEPFQRSQASRRAFPGLPDLQLDRDGRLAVYPAGADCPAQPVLHPSARSDRPRRQPARRLRLFKQAPDRDLRSCVRSASAPSAT